LGEGYRFGKNRAGDLTLCRKAAEGRGVGVVSVEHVTDGGVKVSSSEIRRLIAEKKFREAARLLGRPYALYLENGGYSVNAARGLVINAFAPPEKLLPPDGEYSVTVGGYETSIGLCGGNITLPLGEAAYREGMELNIEFI
jgi:riboflavin kinase/FMN adenylyltransferase